MKTRLVYLRYEYERLVYETNAPKEEIQRAIDSKNDRRIEDKEEDNGISDTEMIEEYLQAKGYYFQQVKVDEHYWF